MNQVCTQCHKVVEEWNKKCGSCGFHLVMVPDEQLQDQYLKTPSLGALLFTQGWAFGSRLYVWFLISLIPGVGLVALFACLFFGRRWSWKYGGWDSWQQYTQRMKLMDHLGMIWIGVLFTSYLWTRYL